MLKGLPLAYNKDMQEDKESVFDAFDTTAVCLEVSTLVLGNVHLKVDRMQAAASKGMMNATELADYLVRKGVAFRQAHELVGRIVMKAIAKDIEIGQLSLDELRSVSNEIEDDVFAALTLEQTLSSKSLAGGTAPERVAEALSAARQLL
jgi:argininosuccinate lyase